MAKLRVDKIAAPIIKDEYTGSVYFTDPGNEYLSIANNNSDFVFGTGDFTIEGWFYINSSGSNNSVYDFRDDSGFEHYLLRMTSSTEYDFRYLGTSLGTFTAAASTWNHIAVARQSGITKIFVNGVLTNSFSDTNNASNDVPILIGTFSNTKSSSDSKGFDGYVSNFRVCKGHAVYTGNFTVPTRELEVHTGAKGVVFPAADNRTVLLACQDAYNPLTEATGRHTITGAGNLGGDFGKNIVTNGDFTDGTTGWTGLSGATLSVENGKLKITESTGAADGYAVNGTAITTVVGVTYKIEWTFTEGTNTSFTVRFGNSGNQTQEYQSNSAAGGAFNDPGTYSFYFTATGTQLNLSFIVNQANTYGYVSNVSVVAIAPISDANPGLFRKTNISSTITENTGSVYFDGTGDGLRSNPYDELILGTGAFTIECWFWRQNTTDSWGSLVSDNIYSASGGWDLYTQYDDIRFYVGGTGEVFTVSDCYSAQTWTHIAAQRDSSGSFSCYINGIDQGVSATNTTNYSDNRILIGGNNSPAGSYPAYVFNGYISNVRVCKGHNVYTSNFAPPTRELEVHPGPENDRTILLCCYDGENIFAEKTGKIIAANGDRLSSPTPTATDSPIGITTFNPGLTRNVDPTTGPTFQGGAGFVSQNWLTLPKGTTAERNLCGTRGLFAGSNPTPADGSGKTIEFITVSTTGNTTDFGDRTGNGRRQLAAMSNTTRGVFAGSYSPLSNIIDYVSIPTTGNAVDFGDTLTNLTEATGISNSTRGIIAGGRTPTVHNVMQYVTIPTLGNATDFGDLTGAKRNAGSFQSSTRGIVAGGRNPGGTSLDVIEYVTIATTGNAVDFGDISSGGGETNMGGSNSTRGLVAGGSPSTNTITYVTISTLGNSVDFGDNTAATHGMNTMATSPTRACMFGAANPARTLSYVEIATTGNALDFGSFTIDATTNYSSGCSSGHGGLS